MFWRSPSPADEIRQLSAELREAEDPFTYARLAELFCNESRLLEARSICEQAIARYPDYARIRAVMARVAEAGGDLERAESELRMVLRAEPHNRPSRVALGRLLIQRGAVAEAKQHLEHALFLTPGDAAARELLAQASGSQPATPQPNTRNAPQPAPETRPLLDQALDLVSETQGVTAALLVDHSGLLIDSRDTQKGEADALSAVVHETWNLARTYMKRMRLGTLRLATVVGAQRTFTLAPCGPGLLAVASDPTAGLGLVNMNVEAARNLLVSV